MLRIESGNSQFDMRILALLATILVSVLLAACAGPPVAPVAEQPAVPLTATPEPAAEATASEITAPAMTDAPAVEPTTEPAEEEAPNETPDAERYAETAAAVEAALDAFAADQKFSGIVLVARAGDIVFAKGYGEADRASGILNDVQTRYRVASVTKTFTAMLVLMLHEQGRLDLGDSICDYIEACPESWSLVTIEQLLLHTGGIADFTRFPDYEPTKGQASTLLETIDRFRTAPLEFPPGERWNYTNSGYILLGHIIEQVMRQSYEDVAQEYLFGPLDMQDTGYDHSRDDLAVGYVNASGTQADFLDMSIPHAAGALYSSAEDLLKWDRALAEGSLISAELQDAMFTPHVAIPDSGGFGYGYGWAVGEEFGQTVAFHSGGIEGFSANLTRFLGDETLIVVLSNQEQTNPQAVARTVMRAIFAGE